MNYAEYVAKCEEDLSNKSFYEVLQKDRVHERNRRGGKEDGRGKYDH